MTRKDRKGVHEKTQEMATDRGCGGGVWNRRHHKCMNGWSGREKIMKCTLFKLIRVQFDVFAWR